MVTDLEKLSMCNSLICCMTTVLPGNIICLNILEKLCGTCQMLLKYVVVDSYCFDLLRKLVFFVFFSMDYRIEPYICFLHHAYFFSAKRQY